jgi:GLPGLI family protein
MNKIIRAGLILNFLLSFFFANSQTIDSAFTTVKYSFEFRPDSTKETYTKEDILILDIGNKYTKYFSHNRLIRDSIMARQIELPSISNGGSYIADMRNTPSAGSTKILYRNLQSNTVTVTDNLIFDNYLYVDSLLDLKWKILKDTLTINGYLCTKAYTHFRGRSFYAWFANSISLPVGPHLFGGLPGLIFQLEESKGNFRYKLLTFEKQVLKKPIIFYSKNHIRTNRLEYRKILQSMLDNPNGYAASHGMIFKEKDGTIEKTPKIPYNPLEMY